MHAGTLNGERPRTQAGARKQASKQAREQANTLAERVTLIVFKKTRKAKFQTQICLLATLSTLRSLLPVSGKKLVELNQDTETG